MKTRWWLVLVITLLLVANPASSSLAQTGQQPWLQVWLVPDETNPSMAYVEYRDASGTSLVRYQFEKMFWSAQAGGRLFGSGYNSITVFDPYQGTVSDKAVVIPPNPADGTYNLGSMAPYPDGVQYAYSLTLQPNDFEKPAASRVYFVTNDPNNPTLLVEKTHEASQVLSPLGWVADGQKLLLYNQPWGIGGYILFMQNSGVQIYDFAAKTTLLVGDIDGYSSDGRLFAHLDRNTNHMPISLSVTDIQANQITSYPLPDIGEPFAVGGGAFFSPDGTKVAYQVARSNPEAEKFWTILVDLLAGTSRIVLVDEGTSYEVTYGHIGGWLDNNTLVVGETFNKQSVLIDATTGTQRGTVSGSFMGYAVGIDSIDGFAPPGAAVVAPVQCPGAPVSRLVPGGRGRVTFSTGQPVNVRDSAGGNKIATEPEGALFTALSGPICNGNYAWWEVQFDNGVYGYVAEGQVGNYFVEPWQ